MVTGGAGFIGSNLVDRLVAARHRVTIIDRVLPRAPYRQSVFTVPKPLRLVLAREPTWTSWIGGLVVRAIGGWQRRVAH